MDRNACDTGDVAGHVHAVGIILAGYGALTLVRGEQGGDADVASPPEFAPDIAHADSRAEPVGHYVEIGPATPTFRQCSRRGGARQPAWARRARGPARARRSRRAPVIHGRSGARPVATLLAAPSLVLAPMPRRKHRQEHQDHALFHREHHGDGLCHPMSLSNEDRIVTRWTLLALLAAEATVERNIERQAFCMSRGTARSPTSCRPSSRVRSVSRVGQPRHAGPALTARARRP